MSLDEWKKHGWLRTHQSDKHQIAELFQIVDRDLEDAAQAGISEDWRFGIAYNAALKLCTILLYAEGFRPEKNLAHYRTLGALPWILGRESSADADYLETCRIKRNIVEYDRAGAASKEEAEELILFTRDLRRRVVRWLESEHPPLNPFG